MPLAQNLGLGWYNWPQKKNFQRHDKFILPVEWKLYEFFWDTQLSWHTSEDKTRHLEFHRWDQISSCHGGHIVWEENIWPFYTVFHSVWLHVKKIWTYLSFLHCFSHCLAAWEENMGHIWAFNTVVSTWAWMVLLSISAVSIFLDGCLRNMT